MSEKILRLTDVKEKTGLSRSSIYLAISKGQFPRPINLTMRAVGWLETDVHNWINRRIAESQNQKMEAQQ